MATSEKEFDPVKMMRDIQDMTLEEEKEYLTRLIAGSKKPGDLTSS